MMTAILSNADWLGPEPIQPGGSIRLTQHELLSSLHPSTRCTHAHCLLFLHKSSLRESGKRGYPFFWHNRAPVDQKLTIFDTICWASAPQYMCEHQHQSQTFACEKAQLVLHQRYAQDAYLLALRAVRIFVFLWKPAWDVLSSACTQL